MSISVIRIDGIRSIKGELSFRGFLQAPFYGALAGIGGFDMAEKEGFEPPLFSTEI